MDRNYYYRLLGLREGASQQEIRAAYETRIARLDSDDYRDDPEYVERKKRQATDAYRVLTGSAPPVSKQQREARFEKFKDYIEKRESGEAAIPPYRFRPKSSRNRGAMIAAIVVIVIVALSVIAGIIVGVVDSQSQNSGIWSDFVSENWTDDDEPEWQLEEQALIDELQETLPQLDYWSGLDVSARAENSDDINWTYGVGEYGGDTEAGTDDIFNNTFYVLYALGISDMAVFYDYVTGEQDFFYDYDDYACAAMLISWLGAPQFEDVAGSVNLYTDQPILDIADYLDYLGYVIDEQSI